MLPTVVPTSLTLSQNAYEAVTVHPQLQGNIRVDAKNGKITLSGKVDTYYLKQLAQESIRKVEGVKLIQNDLTVNWN